MTNKENSALYVQVKNKVAEEYADPAWPSSRRWRARVGLPRLIAERAADEATDLLDGPNLSIHRNEPELHNLLMDARAAARAYHVALMRDNFRRFEGRKL